jgi:hypothetical protein
VDDLIQDALLKGDPSEAFGYIRQVRALGLIKGFGVAKVLYETHANWARFRAAGIDDEWDNVAPAMSGLSMQSCRLYRDTYQDLYANPNVPEWIKPILAGKSFDAQRALRIPARDNELSAEDWEQVRDAVTFEEVRDIVRGVGEPRGRANTALYMWLERGTGIIYAKVGKTGERVVVGKLRASEKDLTGEDYESSTRKKAFRRLIDNAGVMEQ